MRNKLKVFFPPLCFSFKLENKPKYFCSCNCARVRLQRCFYGRFFFLLQTQGLAINLASLRCSSMSIKAIPFYSKNNLLCVVSEAAAAALDLFCAKVDLPTVVTQRSYNAKKDVMPMMLNPRPKGR